MILAEDRTALVVTHAVLPVLPESSSGVATDLEQQLGLVASPAPNNIGTLHHNNNNNIPNNNSTTNNNNNNPSPLGRAASPLKYPDYGFTSGPRSLSDSSQVSTAAEPNRTVADRAAAARGDSDTSFRELLHSLRLV